MRKLYLTNLSETDISKKKDVLFLGDWIRDDYEFEKKLDPENYEIFNSKIFDKEEILKIDQNNKNFKILIFENLIVQLNKYHKVNYDKRYWKNIIEPWYSHFLEAILFRFKIVEALINCNENFSCEFFNFINNPIHFDYDHFIEDVCYGDYYNQFIFQKLIEILDEKKNIKIDLTKNYEFFKKNKKLKLSSNLFEFISSKISKLKKYFIDLNIGVKNYIFLNVILKDIPFKDKVSFSENKNNILFNKMSKINEIKRTEINFNINPKTQFEKFFLRFIIDQIPTSFLEDFNMIQNHISKNLNFFPKIIISDMKYATNTLFKFWIGRSYINGSKIIITDHGGAYGKIDNANQIIEDTSDKSLIYNKTNLKNSFHVPIIHQFKKRNKSPLSELLMICHGGFKYPHYALTSPVSGQALDQIKIIKNFYDFLPNRIKSKFHVRPYQNEGWDLNNRYRNIFTPEKILVEKKKYEKIFKISKLIITTYPKTSFYESFLSGPSILLVNFDHFKIDEKFNDLHEILKKNKMLFENPKEASLFVESVWEK